VWGLAAATGALIWIATLAGFCASLGWLFELTCHFRLQYAGILGVLARAYILLGDLNVTPWSPHFRQLLQQTGLPAQVPPLRIPLDHCLVSPAFQVIERRVGPRLGSDHLPLIVTLATGRPTTIESTFDNRPAVAHFRKH
jgi:hypothetical protein